MEHAFWLTMEDDTEIYIKKWFNAESTPKAVIQLAHGMVEHIERYNEFANYLVEQGFFVYGNDHRGHGKTGERQGLQGYLADQDGFAKTTNDLYEITEQIIRDHPNTPIFLFGHSMGSFLTRNYLQAHSQLIDGVILSGTGYYSTAVSVVGKALASVLPAKEQSKLMNHLSFSSNNKKIKDKKNGFEWLSRDEAMVKQYVDDPFSGFIPTGRFFYDLLTGILAMQRRKQNLSIRQDLPMLIVSGDADPVGDYTKGIWKTANIYEKAGLKDITVMLYNDGRHELLNEINRMEIFADINKWIVLHL
ncbi:alpha/beta hydrolase [Oceanobacillus polygoni]|uniref:Alpha-beta hydrolase superfamily lysophospholipase n=1 Tax=Oceanobacillus polygoni TaxID=1235259 RepID=A0A9X1CBT8_9BACI|nr:alpha/beta hydrolase [Oceanobacillus polygoni]MBP2078069.1 alpha-beta hydrolase superfamily lysophospholipase [Oceanobacillus polygoni]